MQIHRLLSSLQNGLTKPSYTISNEMLNDVMSKPRLPNPYLYTFSIFTLWKSIVYYRLCRDRIFSDKILVSEYKLFKISNKANLFKALVQYTVSQIKMTLQEMRIIATGPCKANQLRDVHIICRRSWYIAAHYHCRQIRDITPKVSRTKLYLRSFNFLL